ncbi:MAG: amino acid ABC transporter ATP-binding protein [Hyphomicrobium sp.]
MPGAGPAQSPTPAIRFTRVSKAFGSSQILTELDLDVLPGEKVTLIGPSGSGKTTVLRLAMTLERPTSGDIRLFGESIIHNDEGLPRSSRDEARIRSCCGMVFQQFNLFPHMTVLENLVLAPRTVLKLDKEESRELAMEHLRLVGLSQKASSYPGQLSGGQQQRIAIARALALRPQILLLDEITSSLDPELAGEVLEVIRNVAHVTQITLLIVTHEMRFAREVSDRVAMFDGGRIVEQGSPDEIFGNPRSERTKAFLQSVLNH